MKLNKVKEIGFYRAIKDERPDYIFEVIKNTDEEWLKDNPKATFLVDEWGYEYTDDDDRRHYEPFGSLIQVQYADEIEVEKMTENFVISGKTGTHLTEDKLTYKEKYLKMKNQTKEIEKILLILENNLPLLDCNQHYVQQIKYLIEEINK